MCREIKGGRFDEADCIKCVPFVYDENADAVRVYLLVRGQLIVGPSGPVDINHLAIHEAMRLYDVQDKQQCFERVLRLNAHFLRKVRDAADAAQAG